MESSMTKISLEHFLFLGAVIFAIGVFGILSSRKNVINILMSIELMLLAVNINFVAFSSYYADMAGQIASIMILTVAAAESAIGLAILVIFYRNKGSILLDDLNQLKG
jgi:NADH-quinone oxidoreductase subunit K